MKRFFHKLAVSALFLVAAKTSLAAGLMSPVNGGTELELTEQHVDVVMQNGFISTEVTQVFTNPHPRDLEALYRFPIPHRASVGEFTYWIDGQPVHAEVFEKQEARDRYAQEVAQGRETALVEKENFRHFDMRVSPVRASDSVKVRLVYLQEASIDHGIGRYVYPLEEADLQEQTDSFWTRNDTVKSNFSFQMTLRSAYPVDAIRVPSGNAAINQISAGEWGVTISGTNGQGAVLGDVISNEDLAQRAALEELANGQNTLAYQQPTVRHSQQNMGNAAPGVYRLDEDIVVYWRLAEDLPGSVDLVTYKDPQESEGTFMLTLTPGIDLAPITEGRDWLFVLDSSGSMSGDYATLLQGVEDSLQALRPEDRFAVVTFADSAQFHTKKFERTSQANVSNALSALRRHGTSGGTNLFGGLEKGLRIIDRDRTTTLLLVTDGVANVGPTQAKDFLNLLNKVDLRVFTAVMGNSANKPLLSAITKHTSGAAMNVSNADDIDGLMMQMISKATHEALHDVSIDINGVKVSELTPYQFARVYRGEQLTVMGKYSQTGTAKVTLTAKVSGERKTYSSSANFPSSDTANPELERLWAFSSIEAEKAIQELVGESQDSKQKITQIALNAGIVTDYTSMLVMREEVFEEQSVDRANAQRIERERLARQQRAAQPVQSTQQDTQQPMFKLPRHTVNNGSGSMGWFIFTVLSLLAIIRITLEVRERRGRRNDALEATATESA